MKCSSELWPSLEGSKAHAFALRHFDGAAGLQAFPATPTTWSCAARVVDSYGSTIGIIRLIDPDQIEMRLIEQEIDIAALAGAQGIGPELLGLQPSDGLMALRYLPPDTSTATPQCKLASYARKLLILHKLRPAERPTLWDSRQLAFAERFRCAATLLPPDLLHARTLLATTDAVLAASGGQSSCLTHGDLNPTNLLWSSGQGWLIDYDHAGWGDPLRDIATLAIALRLMASEERWLLTACLGRLPDNADWWRYKLFAVAVLLRYGLDVATLRSPIVGTSEVACGLGPPPLPFDLSPDQRIALSRRLQHLSTGFLSAASTALEALMTMPVPTQFGVGGLARGLSDVARHWQSARRTAQEAIC